MKERDWKDIEVFFEGVWAALNMVKCTMALGVAYNWGPGATRKWARNGADYSRLPLTTRNYLKKYRKLVEAA